MKKDLLVRLKEAEILQKESNLDVIELLLTKRNLDYVKVWVKTAYTYEGIEDGALLIKVENLRRDQEQPLAIGTLLLTKDELDYLLLWITVAYANEEAFDEVLGLDKYNVGVTNNGDTVKK